jgi:hypothetical protein
MVSLIVKENTRDLNENDKSDLIPTFDGWFKKFCERNNLKTINKILIDRENEKETTTCVKDWFDQIFNQKRLLINYL